jgi:hypothetical protein
MKKKECLVDDASRKIFGMNEALFYKMRAVNMLTWWQNFYNYYTRFRIDFSSFEIPEEPLPGKCWPILVAPKMTYENVFWMLHHRFRLIAPSQRFEHFSKDYSIDPSKEQRQAVSKPYLVWVNATREADLNLAKKSANDLVGQKMITFMERLLLEVFFYCAIFPNEHLDVDSETLCAGSRRLDGYAPTVKCTYFGSNVGHVDVFSSAHPDCSSEDTRGRCVF